MNKEQFETMLDGLIATAIEKICVLGKEDAKDDVSKITEMIEDLENFWNSDGELSGTDFSLKAHETLSKFK